MLARTPVLGYAGCCAAIAEADLRDTAPRITCPALVIGGSEDGASPPETVRALADAIPGATYAEIESAGNLSIAEAPERFAAVIRDFLKEPANA